MGRPRKYATHAERQAAYRLRQEQTGATITVGRRAWEELQARLERLRAAMAEAAGAGVAIAGQYYGGSAEASVSNLALWFERQTALRRDAQPEEAAPASRDIAAPPNGTSPRRRRAATTKAPEKG